MKKYLLLGSIVGWVLLSGANLSAQKLDQITLQSDRDLYTMAGNSIPFIDDRLVNTGANTFISINKPAMIKAVIVQDKPWERTSIGFATIIKDNNIYRAYYFVIDAQDRRFICMATSVDGIKWDKPNLGIVSYNGSKQNNIISDEVHEISSVFKRYVNRRVQYVMLIMKNDFSYHYYVSNDAIHFSIVPEKALDFIPDTHNQIFYDIGKGSYVAYLRSWLYDNNKGGYARTVSFSTIKNISSNRLNLPNEKSTSKENRTYRWGTGMAPAINTEMQRSMILDYTKADNKRKDIYNPAVLPYGNVYYAFPSVYTVEQLNDPKDQGTTDIHLSYSAAGVQWKDLGVYIADKDLKGNAQFYMCIGNAVKGDTVYNYFNTEQSRHGLYSKSTIYMASQVLHRYAGIAAGQSKTAELVTKDLQPEQLSRMTLNFSTIARDGFVIAYMLDGLNNVVDESQPLTGDFVRKVIAWKKGNQKGKRLKFRFSNAILYAINY